MHSFWKHRRHHPHPHPQPGPQPLPAPPPPVPQPGPSPTGVINWPTFTGTAQLVGTSSLQQVSVYVDPGLGSQGLSNAQALLADADRVAALNNSIFGITGVNPVNVVVFALGGATDGTGGADHAACSFSAGGDIEVDASFGSPARVSALFEAELSECAMRGNLCGLSTGESLSRWCSMVASNNALADFATAPFWAQNGMVDYVNNIDPTDQDAVSIGCGMAFLSWVLSQGHTLSVVAQNMVRLGDGGTLADAYAAVTGNASAGAWTAFQAAIAGLPGGVTSDDPFGALATAMG
jgi:hypothetical protein